eukprot:SAG31_NODE_6699_length_1919_cov_2.099451_2_plen_167_part_00
MFAGRYPCTRLRLSVATMKSCYHLKRAGGWLRGPWPHWQDQVWPQEVDHRRSGARSPCCPLPLLLMQYPENCTKRWPVGIILYTKLTQPLFSILAVILTRARCTMLHFSLGRTAVVNSRVNPPIILYRWLHSCGRSTTVLLFRLCVKTMSMPASVRFECINHDRSC